MKIKMRTRGFGTRIERTEVNRLHCTKQIHSMLCYSILIFNSNMSSSRFQIEYYLNVLDTFILGTVWLFIIFSEHIIRILYAKIWFRLSKQGKMWWHGKVYRDSFTTEKQFKAMTKCHSIGLLFYLKQEWFCQMDKEKEAPNTEFHLNRMYVWLLDNVCVRQLKQKGVIHFDLLGRFQNQIINTNFRLIA